MAKDRVGWVGAGLGLVIAVPALAQVPATRTASVAPIRPAHEAGASPVEAAIHVAGAQDAGSQTASGQNPATPNAASPGTTSNAAGLCPAGGNDALTHAIPARLAPEVNAAFGSRMTPAEAVGSTVYRCIGTQVAVCTVGANLNCGKANQDRMPGPGTVSWCRANPDADFVPLFASDHATIYEWSCRGGAPQIGRQLRTVDPQGFVAENWKPLGHK